MGLKLPGIRGTGQDIILFETIGWEKAGYPTTKSYLVLSRFHETTICGPVLYTGLYITTATKSQVNFLPFCLRDLGVDYLERDGIKQDPNFQNGMKRDGI